MDLHTIRQELRTRAVYDVPLRVILSYESDEQPNSLGNQISCYEDLIHKNKVCRGTASSSATGWWSVTGSSRKT